MNMTNKTEHPMAYLFRWIADGEVIEACHVTDDNWKYRSTYQILTDLSEGTGCKKYRIKPNTVRIGEYDIAEPMKEEPANGTTYFWLDPREESGIESYTWSGDAYDHNTLSNSGIWLNKEDALLAAKAIKELLTGTE
jgi:hypothetical protein